LQTRVSPEKRGEQNAELRCGNAEFVFQEGRGDGEISTVHIVDEDGDGEEYED
jgi:hypothetical protein